MNRELAGKVSLVTGAARGIGRAIAIRLADMGSSVAVNDLPDNDEAVKVVREIGDSGGEAIVAPADVTDSKAVKAAVKQITDRWGKIDILVNNAGIIRHNLFLRISDADWDDVIATNLRGAYLCTRFALRTMLTQGWGRVINIASIAGITGGLGHTSYAASKGGLIAFTRGLASEVGVKNITVNAVAPGLVITAMTENLSQEARDAMLSRSALKRFGTAAEVAELVAFLATDRASYITGQVICIDSGVT
ncbi:MAG: 3-oxoacyl-ACP reductase family protein [Dehalococcoidia bacterium]|nr:3-oxoacyl-ACP reductase family protein [Dehalococcoidia bacterium]